MAKRWVGDPTTGHWVDDSGAPTDSPTVGIQVEPAPTPRTGAYQGAQQGYGGEPVYRNGIGSGVSGQKPGATPADAPPFVAAPAAPAPVSDADTLVNRAKALAEGAAGRHTDAGAIPGSTATAGGVDRTGAVQYAVQPDYAGRTQAPGQVDVSPVVGSTIGAQRVGAREVGGPQVSHTGLDYQAGAAQAYQDALAGKNSLADLQLKAAQDRAAAEQLSIAAGARGQGVVAARRNAAANIGLQQMEAGGQMAELRAKEIAAAAAGLGNVGAQVQGENLAESGQVIDVNKTNAGNDLAGQTTNAGNALEAARSNQGNALDVSKTNVANEKDVKLAHAQQQLQVDVASDDRLQGMLKQRADLAAAANAGNQNAAVQLNALDAQLETEVSRFNAQQIQSANQFNVEARLRAMGMDDQYVAQMTQLWIQAENNRDQVQLEKLKIQLQQQAQANQKKGGFLSFLGGIFGTVGTVLGGPIGRAIGGLVGGAISSASEPTVNYDIDGNVGDANGNPVVMSDERIKKDVRPVRPKDIDGFLRAVGKTQTWEYKDGGGRKVGPMAQDMAADRLASGAVGKREDGAMNLDYQTLAALALAGVGRLNDRVEAVEGKPRRKADVGGFLSRRG